MSADPGERRRRLEELFLLATELTSVERAGFLDRHCAGDPGLRTELEELLLFDDEGTKGVLAAQALFAGEERRETEGEPGLPERVGRYRLVEKIGEGGMGSVWIAEQEEPVRRRVAIKFLRRVRGLADGPAHALLGFDAERQALAVMDHPGIARIFDAGTTEGRPWFAMEFAPGVPVDAFCEREGLGLRERLHIFLRVCDAVQHAHQKGVVHRDIKPRNVLVALEGGEPLPKLIDFGIARAVGELGPAGDALAAAGSAGYMAPEQAAGDADVDTRADVYSLGALLYVLVARAAPFDPDAFRGLSLDAMARFLREHPPAPPSRRCADRRLARRLRGELDRIVLHALEPDREGRYGAVSELALDVRRHLANEPVAVVPSTVAYRARKALFRNRALFASAAGIALALVLGVIATTRAMLEAGRQRDAALRAGEAEAEQTALARAEAERAGEITRFLVDTLSLADPTVALHTDLPVRALLDGAAQRVGTVFAERPASEAVVRRAIGSAYASLGSFERAEYHLRRALAIHEADAATPPRELYESTWALVLLYEEADERKGLDLELRTARLRTDLVAAANADLGRTLRELDDRVTSGRLEEAKALFDDLRRAPLSADDPTWILVAETIGNAGRMIGVFWRPADAIEFLEESVAMLRRHVPSTHPDVARHTRWLVAQLLADERFERAEDLLSGTLATYRGSLPEDHWLVADARSRLGECLIEQERLDEALPLVASGYQALRRTLGSGSRAGLQAGRRLVECLERVGRKEDADGTREELCNGLAWAPSFPRRWRETRTAFDGAHAELRGALEVLDEAVTAARTAPSREKQRALENAVAEAIDRRTELPDDHPLSIVAARQSIEWAFELRAEDPGIRGPLYLDALRVLEPLRAALPGPAGHALLELGRVALEELRPRDAEQLAVDAWGCFHDAYGASTLWSDQAVLLRGDALMAQGRFDEAEEVLLVIRERVCADDLFVCDQLEDTLERLASARSRADGARR